MAGDTLVHVFVHDLIASAGGQITTAQLLEVMSPKMLATQVRTGEIVRVCHGVYAASLPDLLGRLAALDLMMAEPVVACLGTAAALYGFDTEREQRLHVLDPGIRMRPTGGVMVHQRTGGPLCEVQGRLVTAPAWTAVEVARTLRRPRALATLDRALRSEMCSRGELWSAVREQKGRRGIVKVRNLLSHADGRAESPMESEARLVFIDGGLPLPELQFEIIDRCGDTWRSDFAWPDAMLVAEYDSMEWHASPEALRHDRVKTSRLQECGYTVVPLVVDDVRRHAPGLVGRICHHLNGEQTRKSLNRGG